LKLRHYQSISDLIAQAESVIRPRTVGGRLFGDVGCALRTDRGNVYLGVCINTASGTGFCAEHSAIAAMVTAGETRIERIVAVWKDAEGRTVVLPPCGRCREFIRQVNEHILQTQVILAPDKTLKLRDLVYHEWPAYHPPPGQVFSPVRRRTAKSPAFAGPWHLRPDT
jgi:cytidine deaminase